MSSTTVFEDLAATFDSPLSDSSALQSSPYKQFRGRIEGSAQVESVTRLTSHAEWFVKALRALTKMSKLSSNWDSYGAAPPSPDAIDMARNALSVLAQFDLKPSSVDPSVEGGVCISFATKERYGDVECFNSGQVLAVTSKGGDEPEVWEVEPCEDALWRAFATIKSFMKR